MKIVIAPGSFKEALSATAVADAIELGFRSYFKESITLIKHPMADGGDGSLECILSAVPESAQIKKEKVIVTNPLGEKIEAEFGIMLDPFAKKVKIVNTKNSSSQQKIAVIEIAKASGLHLVPPEKRQVLESSSYGSGELIKAALELGIRKFIICLGGSATVDCGIGALAACGIVFKDRHSQPLENKAASLPHIASIDTEALDPRLKECHFILGVDVDNPLLGFEGALKYAPQKGATASDIEILHKGLENFALVAENKTGKSLGTLPGGGAAGGLAAGLHVFLPSEFKSGAALIMALTQFTKNLKDASFLITGEGQIDDQTIHGKTPVSVAKLAKTRNIPVIALTASLQPGFESVYSHGIDAVFSITSHSLSKAESIALARQLLSQTAYNVARLLHVAIAKKGN